MATLRRSGGEDERGREGPAECVGVPATVEAGVCRLVVSSGRPLVRSIAFIFPLLSLSLPFTGDRGREAEAVSTISCSSFEMTAHLIHGHFPQDAGEHENAEAGHHGRQLYREVSFQNEIRRDVVYVQRKGKV